MRNRTIVFGSIYVVILTLAAPPALAGSHLWRINEVFSSADGSVQFIEMKECCGANNETGLSGKWIRSDTTGNQFNFPGNLPCCTANRHLLLATAAFAALPGAPTPDYIISENFLDLDADLLTYWMYGAAAFPFGSGELPTDGTHSLVCTAGGGGGCTTTASEVNSPTNFAGETGSVEVVDEPCNPADFDGDNDVGAFDLAVLLGSWGPCPAKEDCPADLDGDGDVGAFDLALLLGSWGPC